MRRFVLALAFLTLAGCSAVAAMIFGLNGEQWDAWVLSFLALAGGLVAAAAAAIALPAVWLARVPRIQIPLAIAGLVVGVGSVLIMRALYSDPYDGDLLWPSVLAWTAFAGLILLPGAALIHVLRSDWRALRATEASR